MMKGQPSEVLAHITKLADFKPLDSAVVLLRLTVGSSSTVVEPAQMVRPGIFQFTLTPSVAGEGEMIVVVRHADVTDTLTIDDVDVFASHDDLHRHHHDEVASDNAELVTFTKEQSWKIDFATEQLWPSVLGEVIRASALVLPAQDDVCEIVAQSSGICSVSGHDWVEGSEVRAGHRLGSIESADMADNNMYVRFQQAEAEYNEAKSTYERQQQLAQDQIVSQSELARGRARYESAKAVYDNMRRNFSRQGATVSSPISGYLTSVKVRNGAYVEAGQPLATVSRNRDLYIRAEVSPRHLPALRHIATANITWTGAERTYTLDELGGALVGYGKGAMDDGPMVPVTFRIRNTANLAPGTFVTLFIVSQSDSMSLSVPNTGIVEEMGSFFVFVQHSPERFEKRMVTLGISDGVRTAITSGVSAGERVVTKGAAMVKLAQSAAALDPHAGHVHSH